MRHPAPSCQSPLSEPSHGHSLLEDLPRIERQLLQRRRALAWLASGAGSALMLTGCGGGGGDDSSTSTSATTTTDTSTTTATTGTGTGSSGSTTSTTTTDTSSNSSNSSSSSSSNNSSNSNSNSCVADAQETAGPYPADGTNTSSGVTSDILTASGVVRSDIRSSFLGSTNQAPGVPVTLTLTLVNTNASCATLSGYAVYLWHCDRDGNYSLYTVAAESYLRGVQVSDSNGQISFTTIFPGCYSGRYPHIHFEVFSSLAAATRGRNAVLTSQLAVPSAACSAVYGSVSGYSTSVRNFAGVSIASDNVFGDNTAAQITAMTPSMTGDATSGYTATATIGLAL